MPRPLIKKLCIIAGDGIFPRQVYDAAKEEGLDIIVIGFEGETNLDLFDQIEVKIFKITKPSKVLQFLKQEGVTHITMAGKVRRADLSGLLFDIKGAKLLAQILKNGLADNSILTTIISFLEKEGFHVIGSEKIAKNIVIEDGCITKRKPSKNLLQEIKKGFKTLKVISTTDVGQALVIQGGLILGIEAAEGTDELIKRCGEIKQREGDGPILVKMCKLFQDKRVDLPCIGPKTIENLAKYGFEGVAVEAEKTIILDKKNCLRLANENKIFIYGA